MPGQRLSRTAARSSLRRGGSLLSAIDALRDLIEADIARVPQAGLIRRDLDELTGEVHETDWDRDRLRGTLERITSRASAVTGVATAAGSVWALIEQILS